MMLSLTLAPLVGAQQVELKARIVLRTPPLPERVALADAIVFGKVESIEEKTISAPSPFGGDTKVEYLVAVVKIDESISGTQGLTHVRVAFQVPVKQGPGTIQPGGRRIPPPELAKDQEACLFLSKLPNETFYVLKRSYDILDKKAFEKDATEIKRLVKLLADAKQSLTSKNEDDRLLAANMLVIKYRNPVNGSDKTAPIDAEESKLILNIIADADWNKNDPQLFGMNTTNMFFRLGLTEKDGWKPPVDGTKFQEEAKKWVKDHADSYRIQRFVAEKGSGK
jgi:hypothetical protein